MAAAKSFEDLEIWKAARELAKDLYLATQHGPFERDFALRDQLRRAAISVVSNIAEGFERSGNPEFIRFLRLAKGSAGEVRAQLYLALDLGYVPEALFRKATERVTRLSRQISVLITYLEGSRDSKPTAAKMSVSSRNPSTLNL